MQQGIGERYLGSTNRGSLCEVNDPIELESIALQGMQNSISNELHVIIVSSSILLFATSSGTQR